MTAPLVVAVLLAIAGSGALAGEVADEDAEEVAARVQMLFRDACARCHGSTAPRQRGSFDFADDLGRVATARALVVPGDPGASPLLERISRASTGADAETGHDIGTEAHELIRRWIELGAPIPASTGDRPARQPPVARRLGQFHPLVVHFPVALLMAALLAEVIALLFRRPALHGTAKFCLGLGTLGAVLASVTGWLWADVGGQSASLHRWLGLATTAFALATCLLAFMSMRADTRKARVAYRVALVATIALLVYAGNTGGEMVYGPDHHVPPW